VSLRSPELRLLSGNWPRANRRRNAPEPLTNAGAPMTADVTQDRRVTEPGHGSSDSAFVDGSRLFWALPSPVHERSGSGSPHPTGYELMRCLPHDHATAQSRISRHAIHSAHRNVPIENPRAILAAVKAAARRLRRWPAASLDRGEDGAAVDHRNVRATMERIAPDAITTMSKACPDRSYPLTTTSPYKPG
jgi:hypothetical protein